MSKFPAQIDNEVSLPRVIDNLSTARGDSVNRLRSAIIAIESELGIKPAGTYSTVRARIDTLEDAINNIDVIHLGGDVGGTAITPLVIGIQGSPVSDVTPIDKQLLIYNGLAWIPSDGELSEDLSGAILTPTVIRIQGSPVSSTAPDTNQLLIWSGEEWVPSYGSFSGDLSGTLEETTVVGLQSYPISTNPPSLSDVLSWSGSEWVPETLDNITLNVLPTSVTLPKEIMFLAGDGYANTDNPTRIGARVIDFSNYPYSYLDGRLRTLKFIAEIEVTNSLTDGYLRLKDVTNNVVITDAVFHTTSLTPTSVEVTLLTGETDGYLRDDVNAMYDVQIYIEGGISSDFIICRNARIEVTYSAPIVITSIVPLSLPTDLQFICGVAVNGFSTAATIGRRSIDVSPFPSSTYDAKLRYVQFNVDVEVSAPGVDGYIQLYDITNNILVTGSQFHFTNTNTEELTVTLATGLSNGSIHTDVTCVYEVRMWKNSSSPADRVICNNARITVIYI